MEFTVWLKAMRLPFLTATIVPVALGSSIAWHEEGTFNWAYFFLTLIGICFLHVGTNLTNDYFDHATKNDELNLNFTPFNGGSRVIQDNLIPSNKILQAAFISFTFGSIIGLYLVWALKSIAILMLGIIGVFCGFFYTASPVRIGYKGLGELIVGLCFGPLVVLGSYYVQAGRFSLIALFASIPIAILITLVLYINEFPDYEADKLTNKRTFIVMLGKKNAIKLYHFLLGLVYLFIAIGVLVNFLPLYATIIIFTLPIALKIYFTSKVNFLKVHELLPANSLTIGLHLIIGLLLSASFVIDKLFTG